MTSSPAGIDCGVDCSESYNDKTVITLTAAANPGSTFTGWGGACSGTGSCVITMDGDQVVTANFEQDAYTLMIVSDHGTVVKSPDQATYQYGEVVQLTATPEAGWTFSGWSGDARARATRHR